MQIFNGATRSYLTNEELELCKLLVDLTTTEAHTSLPIIYVDENGYVIGNQIGHCPANFGSMVYFRHNAASKEYYIYDTEDPAGWNNEVGDEDNLQYMEPHVKASSIKEVENYIRKGDING